MAEVRAAAARDRAAVAGASRRVRARSARTALADWARQAEPGQGRPRLVVVERPVRSKAPAIMAVTFALAILAGFAIVSLNALAAQAAFDARRIDSEIAELTLRHDELVADIAELGSPQRVRAVAISELGLVPATERGFVEPATDLGDPDKRPLPALTRG